LKENEFSDGILVKTRTGTETGASSSGTKEIVENESNTVDSNENEQRSAEKQKEVNELTELFKSMFVKKQKEKMKGSNESVEEKIESLENVVKAWKTQLKSEEDELNELEQKMEQLIKRENFLRDRLKNNKFYLEIILANEKEKQDVSPVEKLQSLMEKLQKSFLKMFIEQQSEETGNEIFKEVHKDPYGKLYMLENQYDSLDSLLDILDQEIDSLKNEYETKKKLAKKLEDIFLHGYTATLQLEFGYMPFKLGEYGFNRAKNQFEVYVKCKTRRDAYDAAKYHGSNGYFDYPIYHPIHDYENPSHFRHFHLGKKFGSEVKKLNDKHAGYQYNFHYSYGSNTHGAVSWEEQGCKYPVPFYPVPDN